MNKVIPRILGLALTLVGGGLLAYLAMVNYGPPARWNQAMFAIGMPMMFVLVLIGAGVLGGGLWLLLRPARRRNARA